LAQIPETAKTARQAGRAELGEDTSGPYYSELVVKLKESDRLRDAVLADVRNKLEGISGFTFGIKQFISERIEEVRHDRHRRGQSIRSGSGCATPGSAS